MTRDPNILFDDGVVLAALDNAAHSVTPSTARRVYGSPMITPEVQLLENDGLYPRARGRKKVVGHKRAALKGFRLRLSSHAVASPGSARPEIDIWWRSCGLREAVYTDLTGGVTAEDTGLDGTGSQTRFIFLTKNFPIAPSSLTIDAGAAAVTDDGSGALTGDGTGTVNYDLGLIDVTFSSAPTSGTSVTVDYDGGHQLKYRKADYQSEMGEGLALYVDHTTDDGAARLRTSCKGARGKGILQAEAGGFVETNWDGGVGIQYDDSSVGSGPGDPALPTSTQHRFEDAQSYLALVGTNGTSTSAKRYNNNLQKFALAFHDPAPEELVAGDATGGAAAVKQTAGESKVTLTLEVLNEDKWNAQSIFHQGDFVVWRCLLPDPEEADTWVGWTIFGQIESVGEPQKGPGSIQLQEVTLFSVPQQETNTNFALSHQWDVQWTTM